MSVTRAEPALDIESASADDLVRARADQAPAVGLHTAEMMTSARALYESICFVRQEDVTHLDIRFCLYRLRM